MTKISSLRTLLENTQAGLDLLMEMDDVQLDIRDRAADLTSALQQEREAADELIEGLREVHIGSGPRGMGYKGKRAHLEELVEAYDEARDEAATMLAEGGDARAEARVANVVKDIVPPSEEEEEEEEEITSLADLIAENIDGSFTPEDGWSDPTSRTTSFYDSIRRLGLRKNAITALEKADICNLGQLISQTPDYLLSLHQFGTGSLDNVLEGLDALGLDWPNGKHVQGLEGLWKHKNKEVTTTNDQLDFGTPAKPVLDPEEKRKEVRRRNAAYARTYYKKNRKKILKQQSVYRQRTRVRLQDLEAKANEGGDQ